MSLKDVLYEARRERDRRHRSEAAKRIAVGTIIGSVIGVASGLLFAPKAGKETREDLANYAKDTTDEVRLRAGEAYDTLREKEARLRTDIKDKYENFVDRNMTELDPVKEDLHNIKHDVNSLFKNAKHAAVQTGKNIKNDGELKNDMDEVAETLNYEAGEVKDEVKKGFEDVKDEVKDKAKDVKDQADKSADHIEAKADDHFGVDKKL